MRAITCNGYNAHTDPLFKRLNLLKVDDIYKLYLLKFYYKFKNDRLPISFCSFFRHVYPSHTHNTRNRYQPRTYTPNTKLSKTTVRFVLPELLSKLPSCITDKIETHSIQGLSKNGKRYFINLYQERCCIMDCYVCEINYPNPNSA